MSRRFRRCSATPPAVASATPTYYHRWSSRRRRIGHRRALRGCWCQGQSRASFWCRNARNSLSFALSTGEGDGAVTVTGGAAVTAGGGGAAVTVVVTGGDGTGCGRALFVVCLPKSVDTNRTSAAVTATTSTARPAHMSRPCRFVGISSVSSSTDQASSGSSPGGGGTAVVSASAPCSDAAVSSVLMGAEGSAARDSAVPISLGTLRPASSLALRSSFLAEGTSDGDDSRFEGADVAHHK
ncbi:MAG: hypothetical protein JWP83_3355 [Mycobacterium sp.]|nr:hypothetical protein [Mycobacterium sp.]